MHSTINRRQFLFGGGVAAMAVAWAAGPLGRFGFADPGEGDVVVPFLDRQGGDPKRAAIRWDQLTEWITPEQDFFDVSHYGRQTLAAEGWKLEVGGRVENPLALTLEQIRARPRQEVVATLECSGNGASPAFMGAIGNARWTGTPLAPLLRECKASPDAVEVAFWGADKGKEKIRGAEYEQNFARSLSPADATREGVMLAYEMNGRPLTAGHGFPLRLIVPGWYGIAWVKWLAKIELRDRRLMNRFMARDYVTVRGYPNGKEIEWKESAVGPINGKSLVARVARHADGGLSVSGAAWTDGTPLKAVELKIDDGPWQATELDARPRSPYGWTFWSYAWRDAKPGEHALVSRAVDQRGRVQPPADDPAISLKKTYWEAYAQYPRRVRL